MLDPLGHPSKARQDGFGSRRYIADMQEPAIVTSIFCRRSVPQRNTHRAPRFMCNRYIARVRTKEIAAVFETYAGLGASWSNRRPPLKRGTFVTFLMDTVPRS
jgi:hypothetical protein